MAGLSFYPSSIDTFVTPTPSDSMRAVSHSAQHTKVNDCINSIQTTLGLVPRGSSASVSARLATIVDDSSNPLVPSRRSVGTTATTAARGNHKHTLSGLTGIVITGTPSNGQVLQYSGGVWRPVSL